MSDERDPRKMLLAASDELWRRACERSATGMVLAGAHARLRQIARMMSDGTVEEFVRLAQEAGLLDVNGLPTPGAWEGNDDGAEVAHNSRGGDA